MAENVLLLLNAYLMTINSVPRAFKYSGAWFSFALNDVTYIKISVNQCKGFVSKIMTYNLICIQMLLLIHV